MGTAYPHKKLRGNTGSHKKDFERYLFIIAIKLAMFRCYHVTIHVHSVHLKPCHTHNWTSEFAKH